MPPSPVSQARVLISVNFGSMEPGGITPPRRARRSRDARDMDVPTEFALDAMAHAAAA